MSLLDPIFDLFMKTHHPLAAGMYSYQSPQDSVPPYRLHLRLDEDGSGVLILNAHTIMHLNQTAAEFCYHLVKQTPVDEVIKLISRRYRIGRRQVEEDYADIKKRIKTLVTTPDIDPVTYLGFEREALYSSDISAPYRLDCALTYLTSDGFRKPELDKRVNQELTFDAWKLILEKAWAAGIPHIIFTGGEPTLRSDLPDLIALTQQIGQVSGLLTDGLKLAEPSYLNMLLEKGLDHIMLVLDADNETSCTAIRNALAADIHLTVHLTLDKDKATRWRALIDHLAELGVYSLSLSTSDLVYKNELIAARHQANEKGMNLVWDLPVPFSQLHPVVLENEDGEALADGAGKAWLYVEPDGDVLPTQGMADRVLGNILVDKWESIWKN